MMILRRIAAYLAGILILTAAISFGVWFFLKTVDGYINPDETPSETVSVFGGYLLTLRDGYVVIKELDSDVISVRYDTVQDTLSEYDCELLKNGLYFVSLDEARRAAEDFCG